ncbi:MAG: hypothetical protein ACKOWJ_01960 [Micrococcales bacterium]
MKTMIRTLSPDDIRVERAKLLEMANVTDISELRKRYEIWDLNVEEYWVYLKLKGLDFLEGVEDKAS